MIVYHGSDVHVKDPKIIKVDRMLDFGEGFYTTSNKEQAIRWAGIVAARRKTNSLVISEYEFDNEAAKNEMTIISFDKPDENWLDFVCAHRSGSSQGEPYDIVMGPVANDQVYAVVLLYEQGVLSKEAAIMELKVRELYDQILFHTVKSLNYCSHTGYFEIGVNQDGTE